MCIVGVRSEDGYILRLDVSERPTSWPVDDDKPTAFMSYSRVRQLYSKHIDHCSFNQLCAVSIWADFFHSMQFHIAAIS